MLEVRSRRATRSPKLKYRSLSAVNHEIRILKLIERGDGRLECKLEHSNLTTRRTYVALSYCWGNQEDTRNIIVDGTKIPVTRNLASALKYLRRAGYVRVWADALCINQDDPEEQSLQVRSMRIIYSQASKVICWVGEASHDDAKVVEYMLKDILPLSLAPPDDEVSEWGGEEIPVFQTIISSPNENELLEATGHQVRREKEVIRLRNLHRKILQTFFGQPYWKRVWYVNVVTSGYRWLIHLRIQDHPRDICSSGRGCRLWRC
jgi:hypothetical protein